MNPNRKPVMAGNWKMYKTVEEAQQYVQALADRLKDIPESDLPEVVICPPFTALDAVQRQYLNIHPGMNRMALGAQNMESHDEGAYTGEVSPRMLVELNVRYVILGHSERRQYYNETDEAVNRKAQAALDHGLTPIVCVGESLAQRESGETDSHVRHQVTAALNNLTNAQREKLILAYEPIWAIGTGKVCDAAEANRVIGLIREVAGVPQIRVLYGGSVKPDNVSGLMAQPEIDGGLVGGASLDPAGFFTLVQAAMPVKV